MNIWGMFALGMVVGLALCPWILFGLGAALKRSSDSTEASYIVLPPPTVRGVFAQRMPDVRQ